MTQAASATDDLVVTLYRTWGPPKQMGNSADNPDRPHFFLHRNFLGEQDLAILFNTKRCRYQCRFCALPFKSSKEWVDEEHVLRQYAHVLTELKHSLGILDRLTIANEGSVLDESTFPIDALMEIVSSTRRLPRMSKLVIETRLEFVSTDVLARIREASGKTLDILTGFETLDERIRDEVLGKREPLQGFESGLDRLAEVGSELTTYVLLKPDPTMTDEQARTEAEASIDYVAEQCGRRGIPFTIRLNPMYVAEDTPWARLARATPGYQPPRLSDVVELAEKKVAEGMRVYLGLTSEGLSDPMNTYRGREDYSGALLKKAILHNSR